MASFFQQITQASKSLTVGDQPDQSNPGKASHIKEGDDSQRQNGPPDESSGSGSYLPTDRQFDFVPTTNDPMRPNFTWAIDGCTALEMAGDLRKQVTVGRWIAVCDSCLLDCAGGQWEKTCQINMQSKEITSAVQFMGGYRKCGRNFNEFVPGI
ncbi:hypothetical protein D6D05_10260 [Aureobasidium pullulans]|nr:hypothetical protein D6D05_10260 [Aureobasidium pullulans]THY81369.1 hypothetical protein D6C95_09140 [Aureobasidium pullulans]TIA05915.1 hypothetical protein D6C80_10545 [Aureobasidium pullulans]